jgi:uncharacterized protein (DUF697 family)
MAGLRDFRSLLSLIGEVDIRPIRAEAERPLELAVVSADPESALHLVEALRRDPDRPGLQTNSPIYVTTPEKYNPFETVDLVIMILDRAGLQALYEGDVLSTWRTAGKHAILILQDAYLLDDPARAVVPSAGGRLVRVLQGNVNDTVFLQQHLVPAVLGLMPEFQLALARRYPLFRGEVARRLINDTCTSNSAYSLTTGLAEIVPVLNIPLNVTDIFVLTKAQAFLVYRLGLALGLPTQWQSYIAEFGGVLGAGFFWRQVARMLIGLIPGFGIIPKVAISYAGTYVVGQVVYQWYLTGRHISASRIRSLYSQALTQGRQLASGLFARRLHLPRRKKSNTQPVRAKPEKKRLKQDQSKATASVQAIAEQVCPVCGRTSRVDAHYCQYCGQPLDQLQLSSPSEGNSPRN